MRVWTAWTAAVLGSFAVLEWAALIFRRFPPYSAVLARWCGSHPPAKRRYLVVGLFILWWISLAIHVMRWGRVPIDRAGLLRPPPL